MSTEQKVRVLDKGSVEERADVVLKSMFHGWILLHGEPYGADLLDPDEPNQIHVVLRDVMDYLREMEFIECKPHH